MKIAPTPHRQRAYLLVKCLFFMAAWVVIASFAFRALFIFINGTTRLRDTGNDIVAAMNVGEQWRADVRAATGPIVARLDQRGARLEIPQGDATIVYLQEWDELIRRQADGSRSVVVLKDVANTEFIRDKRGPVTAWRWELELKPNARRTNTKPLFSFLAVASSDASAKKLAQHSAQAPSTNL